VDYGVLRAIVSRKNLNPYRIFRIRKRPSSLGEKRYRIIAVPEPGLLKVQQWITQRILSEATPHSTSVAFSKGNRLVDAARPHCRCRWLIKLDVRNFFESVSEIAVYRVFLSLGYQPLVSLELARLCTRLRSSDYGQGGRWDVRWWRWSAIKSYQVWRSGHGDRMGHLPQGAPTSPMLANLAMRDFDKLVSETANELGLTYTRYADDLTLSTRSKHYTREKCSQAIGKVYAAMALYGLSPNATKTKILTPGSRKVVLGLLVDGQKPKLLRAFKATIRQHLYYLLHPDIGPVAHARARGFTSVVGLRNHLFGLASFAKQIEPAYGARLQQNLEAVDWPL
jgi:RNA-directed DNA polymerase